MSITTKEPVETLDPSQDERDQARGLLETIQQLRGELALQCLQVGDGRAVVELPKWVLGMLMRLLADMQMGRGVFILPNNTMLTTQEAADILGVSRPFLVKKLEAGEIPFTRVGKHRRVLKSELQAFKDKMDTRADKVLDSLVQESPTWEK